MEVDGFELVAVAQDTGGEPACGEFYDAAGATFTTLIDVAHDVTSLFGMVNVPTGVWIDEQGMIVRPPEVSYSHAMTFGTLHVGDDRYARGLRDWVAHGTDSRYVVTPQRLAERIQSPTPERALADAHFKLAVFLHERADEDGARVHWQASQRLDPNNWNYHRQAWLFEGEAARGQWQRKFEALDGRPYYEPADLPDDDS